MLRRSFIFLLVLLFASACTRSFWPDATQELSIETGPNSLDWEGEHTPVRDLVLRKLQRGLFRTQGGVLETDLVSEWSADNGGRRLVFQLRPDRWSDGVELSAGDFVFAWKRALLPNSRSSGVSTLLEVKGARAFHVGATADFQTVGIRALNRSTLEVTLEKPSKGFLEKLDNPVLGPQREDVFQLHPKDFASPLHLRTIGPYQVLEWKKEESLLLVANSYSEIKPQPAKLRLVFAKK